MPITTNPTESRRGYDIKGTVDSETWSLKLIRIAKGHITVSQPQGSK